MVDESCAVDGVLAIVTRVVMSPRHINLAALDERIQTRSMIGERRRDVPRIPGRIFRLARNNLPGPGKVLFRQRNAGRSGMTDRMGMTSVGQDILRATTLMIDSQGIRAGKQG